MKKNSFRGITGMAAVLAAALVCGLLVTRVCFAADRRLSGDGRLLPMGEGKKR
jgi:hypothetical protein